MYFKAMKDNEKREHLEFTKILGPWVLDDYCLRMKDDT
jgi:hypothetical protein